MSGQNPLIDKRFEEILSAIQTIQSKLPNGEIESMKSMIVSMQVDQKVIKEDLEYFKKRLLIGLPAVSFA